MKDQKSLNIAIIGQPNAGKSSLVNAIVGEKISIVTHKVQTTRFNIKGIYNNRLCGRRDICGNQPAAFKYDCRPVERGYRGGWGNGLRQL